jgi:hypothetical protein
MDGQFGELSQVLGGGGQRELILGSARASQPQAPHSQDPLEMSKEHLDALAQLLKSGHAGQRVSGRLRRSCEPWLSHGRVEEG